MTMVASSTTQMPFGGTAHGCAACQKLHADIKVSVTQITDKLDKLFLRVEELFAQKENGARCLNEKESNAHVTATATAIRSTNSPLTPGKIGIHIKKEAKKFPEFPFNADENGLADIYNLR